MTRVDFAFNADAKVAQAARSAWRHVARGSSLFVYCDDPERLKAFDQALWTVQDTSFVAHEALQDHVAALATEIVAQGLAAGTSEIPVLLVDQANWPLVAKLVNDQHWLLNLDDDCPPEVTLFTRVLEIVGRDEQDRQLARARWRQYQALELDLHAHQLGETS